MIIVEPLLVDATNLLSSTVLNESGDWAAGTYALGARAVYGETVYEVVANPNTTDRPDTGAALAVPTWIVIGAANKWRMFRDGTDSYSSDQSSIAVEIDVLSAVDTVTLLGLLGDSATVEVYGAGDTLEYTNTIPLADIGAGDWWEYFYTPYQKDDTAYFGELPILPGGKIKIIIPSVSIDEGARCGRAILGLADDVGVTLQDCRVSLEDFSVKQRDGFGNLVLVARRTIRILDYNVLTDSSFSQYIVNRFSQLAAKPVLYVGEPADPETINFGVYNRISLLRRGIDSSEYSITVEGF